MQVAKLYSEWEEVTPEGENQDAWFSGNTRVTSYHSFNYSSHSQKHCWVGRSKEGPREQAEKTCCSGRVWSFNAAEEPNYASNFLVSRRTSPAQEPWQ